MPTGYTAKLAEGPQSFEDFVWGAARAMGALVMMREEPTGAPIPERFEPSDYNLRRLREAKAESLRLRAMSEEEANAAALAEYEAAHARWLERKAATAGQAARYNAMKANVEAWLPPTADHQGMKDFMLEQLESSARFDLFEPEEPEARAGLVWQAEGITKAERDIAYHAEEHQKEVARTESRNRWLAALRKSVPPESTSGGSASMKLLTQREQEAMNKALTRSVRVVRNKACRWKQDDNGAWDTGCGNRFEFYDGTPTENGAKFCLYCGGLLSHGKGASK